MDGDATQALDFTDDDQTDDELTSPHSKRPVSTSNDLHIGNVGPID